MIKICILPCNSSWYTVYVIPPSYTFSTYFDDTKEHIFKIQNSIQLIRLLTSLQMVKSAKNKTFIQFSYKKEYIGQSS